MEKDIAIEQLEFTKSVDTKAAASGNVDLLDEHGQIRRIPIPSADPNDPLNLNKWRKLGVMITCCWFSVFSLVLVGGAGSILPAWIELYAPQGIGMQSVVNLTTYPSLVMALGAFAILPASILFGRRPVFLICCLLFLATTIGAAKSNSYNTHMTMRILQGVATGATESVLPLIIADITFIDERGFFFGCYWGAQNFINTIFTITSSYLVADMGWRWFYWIICIFATVGTVLGFFLLPETRYQRSPMSYNGQIHHTDEFGVTQVLSDEEARQRFGAAVGTSEEAANTRQKTYIESLSPISPVAPNAVKLGLGALIKMASSLSSPAVLWAILAASITLGVGIAMTLVYGSLLTEGFGWSNAQVGLINCGLFPAALAAMFFAGYLGDKMNLWLARRRGGQHLPEHTLVTLIFPIIICAIGIIVFAVTANSPGRYSSWGLIMGWTLEQFGFIVVLITTTHFAAEAYPQNPGPALVMVVGLKNVISFGASFGIVPMVHKFDYLTAFMILFGIFAAVFALGIPVYFLNPKWRSAVARRQ